MTGRPTSGAEEIEALSERLSAAALAGALTVSGDLAVLAPGEKWGVSAAPDGSAVLARTRTYDADSDTISIGIDSNGSVRIDVGVATRAVGHMGTSLQKGLGTSRDAAIVALGMRAQLLAQVAATRGNLSEQ